MQELPLENGNNKMSRPKKEKKFNLDEIADYMDKVELGHEPTFEELEGIDEYIEDLKIDSQEDE